MNRIPGVFPGEGAALLWDENLKKKPAYDGFYKGIKEGKKWGWRSFDEDMRGDWCTKLFVVVIECMKQSQDQRSHWQNCWNVWNRRYEHVWDHGWLRRCWLELSTSMALRRLECVSTADTSLCISWIDGDTFESNRTAPWSTKCIAPMKAGYSTGLNYMLTSWRSNCLIDPQLYLSIGEIHRYPYRNMWATSASHERNVCFVLISSKFA